jgi:hypothetical protein
MALHLNTLDLSVCTPLVAQLFERALAKNVLQQKPSESEEWIKQLDFYVTAS